MVPVCTQCAVEVSVDWQHHHVIDVSEIRTVRLGSVSDGDEFFIRRHHNGKLH